MCANRATYFAERAVRVGVVEPQSCWAMCGGNFGTGVLGFNFQDVFARASSSGGCWGARGVTEIDAYPLARGRAPSLRGGSRLAGRGPLALVPEPHGEGRAYISWSAEEETFFSLRLVASGISKPTQPGFFRAREVSTLTEKRQIQRNKQRKKEAQT